MSTPRGVAESYWAAECRRDIDAVMEHYHADATYQDGAGLLHGSAAIRHYYDVSIGDYPGLEVRILREYAGAPDLSAFEVDAVLTDHQGARFGIQGLISIRVRDGKIIAIRCYEDPLRPA